MGYGGVVESRVLLGKEGAKYFISQNPELCLPLPAIWRLQQQIFPFHWRVVPCIPRLIFRAIRMLMVRSAMASVIGKHRESYLLYSLNQQKSSILKFSRPDTHHHHPPWESFRERPSRRTHRLIYPSQTCPTNVAAPSWTGYATSASLGQALNPSTRARPRPPSSVVNSRKQWRQRLLARRVLRLPSDREIPRG